MQADEIREMEVRATYRSAPLTDEKQKSLFGSKPRYLVWTGESASDWQKVRIINRTGSKIAPKP